MSQDNKSISEENRIYVVSKAFTNIAKFCLEKITEDDVDLGELFILETLQSDMTAGYSSFRYWNIINYDQLSYYENRKKNALQINFFGWLRQYIKDWFHNKFNKVQLDLSEPKVIERRRLSNLKDECNRFIMLRLEQVKKYLDKNSE